MKASVHKPLCCAAWRDIAHGFGQVMRKYRICHGLTLFDIETSMVRKVIRPPPQEHDR